MTSDHGTEGLTLARCKLLIDEAIKNKEQSIVLAEWSHTFRKSIKFLPDGNGLWNETHHPSHYNSTIQTEAEEAELEKLKLYLSDRNIKYYHNITEAPFLFNRKNKVFERRHFFIVFFDEDMYQNFMKGRIT